MTIIRHELKQHQLMFWIWCAAICGMTLMIILMFPDFRDQADSLNDMFANMGDFTAAFGMDRLSVASPLGFYGLEGGSIMGIGGGMLFALLGGSIISKEEGAHTAEFLFTSPKKRSTVLFQKLLTVGIFAVVFYAICTVVGLISFKMIGEEVDMKAFLLYQLAQMFLGLEIAGFTFGISAFMHKSSLGISLGLALGLYFLQILSNIVDSLDWIKYITPYCFADAAKILTDVKLEWNLVLICAGYAVASIVAGFIYFSKKDLRA